MQKSTEIKETSNHQENEVLDVNMIVVENADNQEDKDDGQRENAPEVAELKELSIIEKFFSTYWTIWINKLKFFIMPILLIWIGFAAWRVSLLDRAQEPLERLRPDHWLKKLGKVLTDDMHKTSDTSSLTVYMFWGIIGLDRSDVDRWDSTDIGTNIYDTEFDMSSEANQQRIVDICNDLRNSSLVLNGQVECWVQDFWNEMNGGSPVPQSQFYTQLDAYINTTQIGQDQYNDYMIGYINGELRFMRIKSLSPDDESQGYDQMNSLYNNWENLMQSYNQGSPQGINRAFQSGGYQWAWLVTQRELVRGAIQGILISIVFSFVVILTSTLNIVSAAYSIVCIVCIIISVVGTIQMLGWSIGVTESIAVVIIVGFSVDYVVHLANHYVESVYIDRYRRMKDALTGIGISIFLLMHLSSFCTC